MLSRSSADDEAVAALAMDCPGAIKVRARAGEKDDDRSGDIGVTLDVPRGRVVESLLTLAGGERSEASADVDEGLVVGQSAADDAPLGGTTQLCGGDPDRVWVPSRSPCHEVIVQPFEPAVLASNACLTSNGSPRSIRSPVIDFHKFTVDAPGATAQAMRAAPRYSYPQPDR